MQSLTTLEYGKMLALVARYANTPMGRDALEDLQPLTNRQQLENDLRAIDETIALNQKDVNWSFSEIFEPSEAMAILKIQNATLEPLALVGNYAAVQSGTFRAFSDCARKRFCADVVANRRKYCRQRCLK